jgi:hypothetical protein
MCIQTFKPNPKHDVAAMITIYYLTNESRPPHQPLKASVSPTTEGPSTET